MINFKKYIDCSEYIDNKSLSNLFDTYWDELNNKFRKFEHLQYYNEGLNSAMADYLNGDYSDFTKKLLKTKNIEIVSQVVQIGDIMAHSNDFDTVKENVEKNSVRCGDLEAAKAMEELILSKKQEGDSIGGIVETVAVGVPAGLGEPVFERLDGDLARILMNINAVKGVEIGFGFDVATSCASEINDEYYIEDNEIYTSTNSSGGIIGGISNGMPIISRIAVKPTPSISKCQKSVNLEKMEAEDITIHGRHDPCICPRATVVAQSSVAIVLADHMIRSGYIHPSNLEI